MTEPDPAAPRGPERRPSGGRPTGSGRPPAGRGRGGQASGRSGARSSGRPPVSAQRREEIEQRPYDPRREARRQMSRVALPDDVDPRELDQDSRRQLSSLTKETADLVARHLVMAGRLLDEQPEQALAHARAARALGGRVGVVREANGLVAYAAGEWAEALSELRTARRITGEPDHLPVMADCERALGRPDRALLIAEDPQVPRLAPAAKVEMMIVASGARRDMGQPEAAAVGLDVAALEGPVRPWTARLRYAYADALLECGREDEARSWFARAAEVDELGETDADDRVMELDGIVFEDHGADLDDDLGADLVDDLGADPADAPPVASSSVDESTTSASPQVRGGADEQPVASAPVDDDLRLFD
jgi:hypothetical protein